MFEYLKKHKLIFVTGPHRSGTTICAKMIAHDTGHDLVLEDEFTCANVPQMMAFIEADYAPLVIQCPFLSHLCQDFPFDDYAVVFMHRYRQDIIRSEERAVDPTGMKIDFDAINKGQKRLYHSISNEHISDIKYAAWEYQRKHIKNAYDVGYLSLKDHPLWIEKRAFSLRQTEPGEKLPALPRPRVKISKDIENGIRALSNI